MLLSGDKPDPFVFMWNGEYYLTYTSPNRVPLMKSKDLVHWSEEKDALGGKGAGTEPLVLRGTGFCHVWAPEFHRFDNKRMLVLFSAVAYAGPAIPKQCPEFDGRAGVFAAISDNGTKGQFAVTWGRAFAMGESAFCEIAKTPYPRSRWNASDCLNGDCEDIPRIDGTLFEDQGKSYFAYTWFTNPIPRNERERSAHGFHVSLVEMEKERPYRTICRPKVNRLSIVGPGDEALLENLAQSCPDCGRNLSFTKDQHGDHWQWNEFHAGITEGASLFRRGDYVYLLFSHATYDSAYYSVAWVAAKTVEGLSRSAPDRLAGRFLLPSGRFAYGHGSPIQGPDGNWFYVYHRIDHVSCAADTDRKCERDVLISPIEFEEKADGRGPVHIRAIRP